MMQPALEVNEVLQYNVKKTRRNKRVLFQRKAEQGAILQAVRESFPRKYKPRLFFQYIDELLPIIDQYWSYSLSIVFTAN